MFFVVLHWQYLAQKIKPCLFHRVPNLMRPWYKNDNQN